MVRAILIILIILYWCVIGFTFSTQLSSPMQDQGYSTNANITGIDASPPTGIPAIDILRLIGIALWGIGLPAGTPIWFALPFAVWQIGIFIVFILALIA
jgi:hypothetical protein